MRAWTKVSVPAAFAGTPAERLENYRTHFFSGPPGDERCLNCDSRPSYTAASYRCGVLVPRHNLKGRVIL